MCKKILIMLFTCIFLTSCGSVPDSPNKSQVDPQKEVEKYNSYVHMTGVSLMLSEIQKDYFNHIGKDEQPKKIEGNKPYRPSSVSDSYLTLIEKASGYAEQEPAFSALDNDIKEIYPKLTGMVTLWYEIEEYYNKKEYLFDDYQKAQLLHTRILNLSSEFQPLHEKLLTDLNAFSVELEKKEMDRWKKADFMIHYSARDVLIKAKALQEEMNAQNINSSNILDMNAEKFEEKYDQLTEALEQFRTYLNDENRRNKEGIRTDSSNFKKYYETTSDLKASASEIFERVRDKKALERYELMWPENTPGTPEKYTKKLTEAGAAYNNLKN